MSRVVALTPSAVAASVGGCASMAGDGGGGSGNSHRGSSASPAASASSRPPPPIPHIDDLTTFTLSIDRALPLRKIIERASESMRASQAALQFGRPAQALKGYFEVSTMIIEIVPTHKDYPAIKTDLKLVLASPYNQLIHWINDAHDDFEQIKRDVIADNARTKVQPTVQKPPRPPPQQQGPPGHQARQGPQPRDGQPQGPQGLQGDREGGRAGQTVSQPHSRPSSVGPPPHDQNKPRRPTSSDNDVDDHSIPLSRPQIQSRHSTASTTSSAPDVLLTRFSRLSLASNSSSDFLANRFSRLGGPQAASIQQQQQQDPRIRTHPIAPPSRPGGPRAMPLPPGRPLTSITTDLPSLPKVPEAIYSPARGTVSREAAQLPSSTPRLFSRASYNTPHIVPSSATAYSSSSTSTSLASNGTASSSDMTDALRRHQSTPAHHGAAVVGGISLSHRDIITPLELMAILRARAHVLIIDIRPRDQFSAGHIESPATICIEPSVLMRRGVSAEQIADSNSIAPAEEAARFQARDTFDLVVFYDQSSDRIVISPQTEQEEAVLSIYTALTEFNYGRELALAPHLLWGGFSRWVRMTSDEQVATSPLVPGTRITQTGIVRHSTGYGYMLKPLDPGEVSKWNQKLESDTAAGAESKGFDFAKSTEEFLRRYPEVRIGQKESMRGIRPDPISQQQQTQQTPPPHHYGASSHQAGLYTDLPTPPTRPAPTAARPSYSGLSATVEDVTHIGSGTPSAAVAVAVTNYRTGLHNPGAWCYANSILQVLRVALYLTNELSHNVWQTKYRVPRKPDEVFEPPQLLTRIMSNLFHWQNTGKFSAMRAQTLMDYARHVCLKNDTAPAEFGGPNQQDAQEFFFFLLAHLGDETNGRRDVQPSPPSFQPTAGIGTYDNGMHFWQWHTQSNISIVDRYWTGVQAVVVHCSKCKHSTTRYESFNTLSVAFSPKWGDEVTLVECLTEYFKYELIRDYTCDGCGTRGHCRKNTFLARLPDLLCVTLGRFCMNDYGELGDKIMTRVDFDFDSLSLQPYFVKPAKGVYPANVPHQFDPSLDYECFGLVVHQGPSIMSGHYYSYIREPAAMTQAQAGGQAVDRTSWVCFNDSIVNQVRVGTSSNPGQRNSVLRDSKRGAVPYMLFFRRKVRRS